MTGEKVEDAIGIDRLPDPFDSTWDPWPLPPTSPFNNQAEDLESYASPLLPGFELPLAKILAEADMLDQAQQ